MKLSVIIPTCNRNELLGLCLDKLAPGAQTLPASDYEVIVSDDGKDYPAEAFCKLHYPWVRYTRGPQKGPAANRNKGAKLAVSGWLIFLDDDCLPDMGILQAYLDVVNEHPGSHVLEGIILPEGPKPNALSFAPIKQVQGFLWSCNFAISKTAFNSVEGFDEVFRYAHMEDKDLQVRLEKAGFQLRFVPAAFVIHPWRVLTDGRNLGIREESFVYYCSKHGLNFRPRVYVRKLFFFYFSRVRENWSFFYAWTLFRQYLVHLYIFFKHYKGWKEKYTQMQA